MYIHAEVDPQNLILSTIAHWMSQVWKGVTIAYKVFPQSIFSKTFQRNSKRSYFLYEVFSSFSSFRLLFLIWPFSIITGYLSNQSCQKFTRLCPLT